MARGGIMDLDAHQPRMLSGTADDKPIWRSGFGPPKFAIQVSFFCARWFSGIFKQLILSVLGGVLWMVSPIVGPLQGP
jgi:hypothetical protein